MRSLVQGPVMMSSSPPTPRPTHTPPVIVSGSASSPSPFQTGPLSLDLNDECGPPPITTEMTEAIENGRPPRPPAPRNLGKCVLHPPETGKFQRSQGEGEGTPHSSGQKQEWAWKSLSNPVALPPASSGWGVHLPRPLGPAAELTYCRGKPRPQAILTILHHLSSLSKIIFVICSEISNCIHS